MAVRLPNLGTQDPPESASNDQSKDAKPYQIRDARSFLEQAGIKP
jgi:hypothetical protein